MGLWDCGTVGLLEEINNSRSLVVLLYSTLSVVEYSIRVLYSTLFDLNYKMSQSHQLAGSQEAEAGAEA